MAQPEPEFVIAAAAQADVGEIWTLLRAAFVDEAQAYGDPFIAPLTEAEEQVRAHLAAGQILLKAVSGGRIIGTVRGRSTGPTFLVNRLAVAPDMRRRGIARRLLAEVERHALRAWPGLEAFALFTGDGSGSNLRLYRELGYAETHRERIADHLTMVHLRKSAA